jgi:hypothetical protein
MISVPENAPGLKQLKAEVEPTAKVHPLNIPPLRCGTLDDLMSLSDELEKVRLKTLNLSLSQSLLLYLYLSLFSIF